MNSTHDLPLNHDMLRPAMINRGNTYKIRIAHMAVDLSVVFRDAGSKQESVYRPLQIRFLLGFTHRQPFTNGRLINLRNV
jgi:hypothetical protein